MKIVTIPHDVMEGSARAHLRGIVEATRAELAKFLPRALVDQLPEGRERYAFGCWNYAGCDCPAARAGKWPGARLDKDLLDSIKEYDLHCIGLLNKALADAEGSA